MPSLLTKRERASYSVRRLIEHSNVRGNPNIGNGIEADLSRVCRHQFSGLTLGGDGAFIPPEILIGENSNRALVAGNFAGAGALTSEEHDSVFYKYLFPQSIVFGLGANFLGGLDNETGAGGRVSIPVVSGAAEGTWLDEGQAAPDQSGSLTAALAQATPKRVVARIVCSNQLLKQSGPAAESALWRVLMAGCAAAIDRAALAGAGGVQPVGVLNLPGTTIVSMGDNGAALTRAKLCEAEAGPVDNNTPLRNGGYALSPNTREKAKNIQTATGASTFLVETVAGQDFCSGFRAFATPLLPDNLAKGNGSGLGSLIFGGDWSVLHCIQWGGAMVVADPYSQALNNRTILTITLFLDIVSPHAAAFSAIRDIVNS